VRDREIIDSELLLITAVRRTIREHGGEPSSRQVDKLLDERLAHRGPGPARTRQSTHSGGAYAIAPHCRHVQLVWPPGHEHGW
jgi:hypothetical protein